MNNKACCAIRVTDVYVYSNNGLLGIAAQCWIVHETLNDYKNSSGDEIANVNFLRRYGTYVLQNTKKENLLRLTN